MSRIGKKPILIPEGVGVNIEGQKVIVKGPKGEIAEEVRPEINVEIKENKIFLSPQPPTKNMVGGKQTPALWGLFRALIYNAVQGVTVGFEKKLEIEGVGFKAEVSGGELILSVGFSHPVKLKISEGLKVTVEKNVITVSGIDKELVGEFSAIIRRTKPCEPYKGKGIKYFGEKIRRKAGKKVVAVKA